MFGISEIAFVLDPIPARPEIEAYVSLLYGEVGIRDLRIVRLSTGRLTLVFPDHAVRQPCVRCPRSVPITFQHFQHCGVRQPVREPAIAPNGKPHKYISICFPTTNEVRAEFERVVFAAYRDARLALMPRPVTAHARAS